MSADVRARTRVLGAGALCLVAVAVVAVLTGPKALVLAALALASGLDWLLLRPHVEPSLLRRLLDVAVPAGGLVAVVVGVLT